MRYRLRTLLLALALGPPIIAVAWWYGRIANGVIVLAPIACPELLVFIFGGLIRLIGGKRSDGDTKKPD